MYGRGSLLTFGKNMNTTIHTIGMLGLGAPELLILIAIHGIFFLISAVIGYQKNRLFLGAILGFLLGLIGVIIIACIPKSPKDNLDALMKLSELKEKGIITEAEFAAKKKEYLK